MHSCIKDWNNFKRSCPKLFQGQLTCTRIKSVLTNHLLNQNVKPQKIISQFIPLYHQYKHQVNLQSNSQTKYQSDESMHQQLSIIRCLCNQLLLCVQSCYQLSLLLSLLFIYLFVYLFIFLLNYLFIYLFIYSFIYLFAGCFSDFCFSAPNQNVSHDIVNALLWCFWLI